MTYQTPQASKLNQTSWLNSASTFDAKNGLVSAMRREIDHVFEEFGHYPSGSANHGPSLRMNVSETENAIEIEAELPGIEEKDVELALNDDVLTLKGEKRMEHDEQRRDYSCQERTYGRFARSITLPFAPDPKTVKTLFGKGVLTITLPKSADVKQHTVRIPLRTSN
jgi:HSP20 family protein